MSNVRKIFSKIYDEYIGKIYRFIFLKVNSQEVAEDLTSETFLKGWESFRENHQNIENPTAFLYQIARNLVIDFYREKGKTRSIPAENVKIIDPRINIEEKAALNSDLEQIRANLASLKEDYQEVIIWHYLDDLSVPEIAKILDRPEGTVRVMLHRGLNALRESINSEQRTIEQ